MAGLYVSLFILILNNPLTCILNLCVTTSSSCNLISNHFFSNWPLGHARRCHCDVSGQSLVSKHRDQPYQAGRSKHWIKNATFG